MRSLFYKGLQNPNRVIPFLKKKSYEKLIRTKTKIKYRDYAKRNQIVHQKNKIDDLLLEDEFVLIILDACRYDYFSKEIEEYITGELELVWSAGNRTPRWTPNLWEDEYDLDYISVVSFPVAEGAYENRKGHFSPESTFSNTIHLTYRNDLTKTVHPKMVTDVALDHIKNTNQIRTVVHYPQPHEPYIGETKVYGSRVGIKDLKMAAKQGGFEAKIPDDISTPDGFVLGEKLCEWGLSEEEIEEIPKEKYSANMRVSDGLVSDNTLQKAYRDNLRLVLSEVKRLIKYLDCKVVISADHGEHLGEYTNEIVQYFHPDETHPILRKVPWFVVQDDCMGSKCINQVETDLSGIEDYDTNASQEEIQEHLEALGYVD